MPKAKAPKMIKHIVSQEDLDSNPDFVTEGISVGDEIEYPEEEAAIQAADKAGTVKKVTKAPNTANTAKAPVEAPVAPLVAGAEPAVEVDEDKAEEDGKVDVKFIDPQVGLTTRTFDRDTHGEDFVETAKAFVATHQDKGAMPVQE